MITERDFVLNNYCSYYNQSETIKFKDEFIVSELKKAYKTICENTSDTKDESDDFFSCKNAYRVSVNIKFKNVNKIEEVDDCVYVYDREICGSHILKGVNAVKFKEWFERKRG